MIQKILEYNKAFVKEEAYKPYITSKYPDKKLAILTCMDARLTALLPAALGIKNGDAKIIKNAPLRKCRPQPFGCHSGAWR